MPALGVGSFFHLGDFRDEAVVAVPASERQCQVLSLNTAGQAGNLAVLDLSADMMTWAWVT